MYIDYLLYFVLAILFGLVFIQFYQHKKYKWLRKLSYIFLMFSLKHLYIGIAVTGRAFGYYILYDTLTSPFLLMVIDVLMIIALFPLFKAIFFV